MVTSSQTSVDELHKLSNSWTIYAHLPHDTDWSLQSYKTLFTTSKMEEFITVTESLPDQLISNCMLFIMKDNIKPIWEDVHMPFVIALAILWLLQVCLQAMRLKHLC